MHARDHGDRAVERLPATGKLHAAPHEDLPTDGTPVRAPPPYRGRCRDHDRCDPATVDDRRLDRARCRTGAGDGPGRSGPWPVAIATERPRARGRTRSCGDEQGRAPARDPAPEAHRAGPLRLWPPSCTYARAAPDPSRGFGAPNSRNGNAPDV